MGIRDMAVGFTSLGAFCIHCIWRALADPIECQPCSRDTLKVAETGIRVVENWSHFAVPTPLSAGRAHARYLILRVPSFRLCEARRFSTFHCNIFLYWWRLVPDEACYKDV